MKYLEEGHVYKGDIIFALSPDELQCHEDSYVVVNNGKVEGIYKELPDKFREHPLTDYGKKLILPGFVDLHVHAPQFLQRGIGLDTELLTWLNHYTYPLENLFYDPGFAREMYARFVEELLRQGTLRACVLATVHLDSTKVLFEILKEKGMGAYVGKINMDRNCPDYLKENTETSLKETEELVNTTSSNIDDNAPVNPILTPRFAPTSSEKMLKSLGDLAAKYCLPVQSHLAENKEEVKWVKEVYPAHPTYADVYYQYGLFGQTPTLMAHGIHLTESEQSLTREMGVKLVHCPDANMNLSSGIMPVRRYLEKGIKIGLGSDVGAGHTLSMSQVMVSAIQLSKINRFAYSPNESFQNTEKGVEKPLTLTEVFYLATKGGGGFFNKVGSFEKGYSFDALIVDEEQMPARPFSPWERLQRFLYSGSPNLIVDRFIGGRKLAI